MYNIKYYYSSLSKQTFLIIFIAYTIARICIFHIGGFSQFYYPLLSTLMYLGIIAISLFLLNGYRLYYVSFDEKTVTIHNKLLKKEHTIEICKIKKAEFTRLGIKLYTDNIDKASHIIPIYFFGKISPVGCENFEIMLKNMKVPEVNKAYNILPGFGRISTIIGYVFFFSCIPFLISSIQLFELIYLILKS